MDRFSSTGSIIFPVLHDVFYFILFYFILFSVMEFSILLPIPECSMYTTHKASLYILLVSFVYARNMICIVWFTGGES